MSKTVIASLVLAVTMGTAWAQNTPVGKWHTIDDKTKEVKSEVTITETEGVLSGKISKLLRKDAKQDAVCEECKDARKGKPILGMEIARGAKKETDADVWSGGKILNPEDGKEYNLKFTPLEGGKKLNVRGYIGSPLFGKTQTWVRVE
jgi:uncharacterized protein (DUF2147 family)